LLGWFSFGPHPGHFARPRLKLVTDIVSLRARYTGIRKCLLEGIQVRI